MNLKAIFESGDRYVLVRDESEIDEQTPARIIDIQEGVLFAPMKLGSIMSHNPYLEEIDEQPENLSQQIADAEVIPASEGDPDVQDPHAK
jgi:hypothetical protein